MKINKINNGNLHITRLDDETVDIIHNDPNNLVFDELIDNMFMKDLYIHVSESQCCYYIVDTNRSLIYEMCAISMLRQDTINWIIQRLIGNDLYLHPETDKELIDIVLGEFEGDSI